MRYGRVSRMPKVGDVIVESCPYSKKDHPGVVYEIGLDRWGHQRHVFIHWADDTPIDYSTKHGYHGVNIHNCRGRFTVIRSGVAVK